MKLSWFGRMALALFASLAMVLGMTACGSYTVAYIWVPGQQYNQIAGFKVDDFTGNLTQIPTSPFASQGTNPIMMVVKTGGRYVYVLNQGVYDASTGLQSGAGIAEFSVGGDGVLNFEQIYQSQGLVPTWLQFDSTGNYLFVLDKYSASGDGNGSITTFSSDPTTGRLTLVQQTENTQVNSPSPTYVEVGGNPIMMKSAGSCLYTVNSRDQSITPYGSGGNGQLSTITTGNIPSHGTDITSINGSQNYIILTDAGSNTIIPYTVGSNCSLNSFTGGAVANAAGTSNPVQSLITANGRYLYVLNQSTSTTGPSTPYSSISGWEFGTNGLTPLTGSPFAEGVAGSTGAGPVCIVEDPTSRFLYISDHNSGTVTGKSYDPTSGLLSQLKRGSTFSATGQANCLALSGAVD